MDALEIYQLFSSLGGTYSPTAVTERKYSQIASIRGNVFL